MNESSPQEKYLVIFFGDSSDYYLTAYRNQMVHGDRGFNIAAFLLGIFWLLYRKMYGYALGFFVIIFAIDKIIQLLSRSFPFYKEPLGFVSLFITFAASIVMGFKGTPFYLGYANRKVNQIVTMYMDETQRIEELKKMGGTNVLLPWIAAGILVLLSLAGF